MSLSPVNVPIPIKFSYSLAKVLARKSLFTSVVLVFTPDNSTCKSLFTSVLMATKLARVYSLPFLTFIVHLTFITNTTATTTTMVVAASTKPERLVTKLIHRDSIFSPYYNPNDTIEDRAWRSLNSSIARLAYLYAGAFTTRANLLPNPKNTIFYLQFSIGQPPMPQFAVMDTGSSNIWVDCHPCAHCYFDKSAGVLRCYEKSGVFDPSKSSTYATLPCNRCFRRCNYSLNQCLYNLTYVDGSGSEGDYATEQLTFETSDEGEITVANVEFGCGHKIISNRQSDDDEKLAGVFGLGFRSPIFDKFGSKFSYCIGNISDSEYQYNQLILGDGAEMEGYSTPFEKYNGHYYITQEGISVGEKRLDIDANIFKRTTNNDGVVIDSGSTYTWLTRSAYDTLRKEVESLFEESMLRNCLKTEHVLCCKGTIGQDLYGFPIITFHFADGAELVLDAGSSFIQVDSYSFCLAIRPSDSLNGVKSLTLIGILAQQSYNVGHDLEANRIFFQRIDCELLAD